MSGREVCGTAPSCAKPTEDGPCCRLPGHAGGCFGYDTLAAAIIPRPPVENGDRS